MDMNEVEIVEDLEFYETSTDYSMPNQTITIPTGSNHLFVTKVIVQTIILTLAIFGNTCLFIVMRMRKRNITRMHVFILHLCFADMLVAIFNILPQLIWEVVGEWKAGDFMCRLVKFMQIFVMYLSTYVLVLTALDRRAAICSPLLSHTWTHKLVHLSVGGVYILSAVLSIPQAIIFKYQETLPGTGLKNCWVHFHPEWTLQLYITSFTILVYIVPLCILIFAYGSIYYTIFLRQKQLKLENGKHNVRYGKISNGSDVTKKNGLTLKKLDVSGNKQVKKTRSRATEHLVPRSNAFAGFTRAKLKTVKLTLVIILAYIACWSPFFISQLWWLYDETAPASNDALVIMILLASLNSCCNPWIYMVFTGSISLRGTLQRFVVCGKPRNERHGEIDNNRMRNERNGSKICSTVTTPLTPTPSSASKLIVNIHTHDNSAL